MRRISVLLCICLISCNCYASAPAITPKLKEECCKKWEKGAWYIDYPTGDFMVLASCYHERRDIKFCPECGKPLDSAKLIHDKLMKYHIEELSRLNSNS